MISPRMLLGCILALSLNLVFGQSNYWSKADKFSNTDKTLTNNLNEYDLYDLQVDIFSDMLPSKKDGPTQINLPGANGIMQNFQIWDAPIMQSGLAEKYPNIRTFLIQNLEDPSMHGRLSFTRGGMKAYITSSEESYLIHPTGRGENMYVVFKKSERKFLGGFKCGVEGHIHHDEIEIGERSLRRIGEELKIYRLAVSTTGEYSSFHGGNNSTVMEAIVESVNQINVVFENDFSLRFILVDNNDMLINLDPNNDPFDNQNPGQMLNANPGVINSIIGAQNYDIGHVFATAGAGLASLRSSCANDKARGVTGISPPEGNTFDIDYAAHEFGHQLGSNHTFNNCGGQEVPAVAYEPGSGSTIMAYAGLCGSNNVQFSSDDYFHVSSLIQISPWIEGVGGACAEKILLDNNIPTVEAGEGGFYIPIETPFALTAEGSDPDGDAITYCWEQFNRGPQSTYGEPQGNAPSFRSQRPTNNPTRFFPKLNVVVGGIQNNSEVLPSESREMDFQCTVRDNKPGGGALAWDAISFEATSEAGPFVVTSQSERDVEWETHRLATVTWDVANTDQAPVNCQKVNIIMSTNFGINFDLMLAENVDNNGSHTFFVPEEAESNFAFVMVQAADNVFYNVNSERFKVVEGLPSSIDQTLQSNINIFPNPTDGSINIELAKANNEGTLIELIDVQGRLVREFVTNLQKDELQLDLPNGIYYLRILQDNRLAIKKIAITK